MMITKKETIRLIALPLVSKKNQSPTKPLTYYYAHRLPSSTHLPASQYHQPHFDPPVKQLSPTSLIKKLTDLGTKHWTKLAHSKHGSWKLKIYNVGESMMDKIPFEEWALKTIDPAINIPSFQPQRAPATPPLEDSKVKESLVNDPQEVQDRTQIPFKIELLYPPSVRGEQELMDELRRSMIERAPYHRKWMKLNVLLSPLTLPFVIVPLIPNLPFFYMMWRAWSHWRAYQASRYLNVLIERGYVLPIPSPILDDVYTTKSREGYQKDSGGFRRITDKKAQLAETEKMDERKSSKEDDGSDDDYQMLLLSPKMVTLLRERLDLPPESVTEIVRGIQQARHRLLTASPRTTTTTTTTKSTTDDPSTTTPDSSLNNPSNLSPQSSPPKSQIHHPP